MSMKTGHCSQRAWATVLATVLICISAGVAMADPVQDRKEKIIMPLAVTSLSFQHNGTIPARHTCDGRNVSPPLSWTGVPVGAKSLVMIIDDPDAPDPDAPMMTWVHWVLYNIPPGANGLPESVAEEDLPPGTLQGMNSWQHTGYGGPCPPIGNHRYYHKLYALDTMLPDLHHPTEAALEKAMGNHIIARAELIGRYRRH